MAGLPREVRRNQLDFLHAGQWWLGPRYLEYPTGVDSDNVPNAWGTITLASDTTSGCTANGRMHWDASLLTGWVTAYSVPDGAAMLKFPNATLGSSAGMLGYYVRLRTTAPGTTPIVSDCHASNYLNQSGTKHRRHGAHLAGGL